MEPHALDRGEEAKLLVADEADGAVHQPGDERADADAEHERDRRVARQREHREHDRARARCSGAQAATTARTCHAKAWRRAALTAHPLTPLATTPATK